MVAFDMAMNYYKGRYATTHGRTYPSKLLGGLSDSTLEAIWVLTGLAAPESVELLNDHHFTASNMATNDVYVPPPILEDIAWDARDATVHKQHDSLDIEQGPAFGIGYESHEDVMFWWGHTGYIAPDIIDGSLQLIDDYNMWEGNTWSGVAFLKPLVGTPIPRAVAELVEPMSRGIMLEGVDTYTYRTPHYQLSGAQGYKPTAWTGQVHVWKAVLDPDAYVFTTYPGGTDGDTAGGPWTGGFLPRALFFENVGVIQYRRPRVPFLDSLLFTDYSHAYVPRSSFDEFVETEHWVIGRKGEGYVALYSQTPPQWSEENDAEWIAGSKENVWIVELGDAESSGEFDDFVGDILGAQVQVRQAVTYDSPSQGTVQVGWAGPMTVAGEVVDTGPYARWDNDYAQQPFGTAVTDIELDGQRLELDFEKGRRRYWRGTSK